MEALGVPHTEIDLILVNEKSVDFNYILQNKDRVSVYPVFESLNITDVTLLRKTPLRRNKFIVDINLGDIAKYMRVLGFNLYYNPLLSTREIIEISKRKEPFSKCSILFEIKGCENFNHRNTCSISRIKI